MDPTLLTVEQGSGTTVARIVIVDPLDVVMIWRGGWVGGRGIEGAREGWRG